MSNCCMRRSAKFHVDSAVRFLAIANIREGGALNAPPPVKRGLIVNTMSFFWNRCEQETSRKGMAIGKIPKDVRLLGYDHARAHQRSAAIMASTKRWTVAPNVAASAFFQGFSPLRL